MPARGSGGASEGVGGSLMMVIWRQYHQCFSASYWQSVTYAVDDALRLGCAKSFLGVQLRIPCSDRVRSPWGMGILPAVFRQGQPWGRLLTQMVGRRDREGARQIASS